MKRYLYICTLLLLAFMLVPLNLVAETTDSTSEAVQEGQTENVEYSSADLEKLVLGSTEFPADVIPPSDLNPNLPIDDTFVDPSRVFGVDNRVDIQNTTRTPYRQVTFVIAYKGSRFMGAGSGVMISSDKVLTAAHVLRDVKTNEWADSVTVFPGRSRDKFPYGGRTGFNYHVFSSYKNNLAIGYNHEKMKDDLAVLTLASPFSPEVGQLSVVNAVSPEQRVALIGYPGSDRKEDIGKIGGMFAASGAVLEADSKLIYYQIDTTPGHSGGPVIDSNNQIVAINVAENNGRNMARRINTEGVNLINASFKGLASGNGISYLKATFRLYHAGEKYHVYSSSINEKDTLVRSGWKYEGIAWRTDTGGEPIYRLYNTGIRRHIYTKNIQEKNVLQSRGWRYEGVAWHSSGNNDVYRLYHPTLKVHLYTMDTNEKNVLSTRGWRYEGIAWTVE